ncbi:hypothetical protein VN12_14350 [Pirellula sp. SH-Sr6A]|uniref:hypothetical protein n=1 Tax=Pirellula sp. SH-Sr6A TaxID=1632865 RepID=UPI00078BA263|nr:hypothetical protein [Pirellula sp. SH-Sr6A]AMV33304.1 hypothetical protein VN12_14350 [Pirellula sp. SH-Sr6A]
MNFYRAFVITVVWAACTAIEPSIGRTQSPVIPLPAFNALAWEVRISKPLERTPLSWQETLERIARGYRQRWMSRAAVADMSSSDEDVEDPLEHAFLGVKWGARTLLVPEGMVMTDAVATIHPLQGDTLIRIPVSIMAERGLSDSRFRARSEGSVSVRLQTVGVHASQSLHPAHAASVSRLVSHFPLLDDVWSEEEKKASIAWMDRLRENPVDYVVLERVDRVLGVCQIVVPLRASLLSTRVSLFLDRHVDAFAAMPIEPSDRVTCMDGAMLRTIWGPWQSRVAPHDASMTNSYPSGADSATPSSCLLPSRRVHDEASSNHRARLIPSFPR